MITFKILDRELGFILNKIHERDIEFDTLKGHRHKVAGRTFIADETISKYDAVRISGTSRVVKAQATTTQSINARVIGIATANVVVNQRLPVITWGEVSNTGWSFNIGEAVYVQSTAGLISTTVPATNLLKGIVGVAIDASTVFVNPDQTVTT